MGALCLWHPQHERIRSFMRTFVKRIQNTRATSDGRCRGSTFFLFSSASSEWQSYKVNKSYLLWMERAAEWCRLNMTVVMEHDGGDKACLTRRTIKNYCSKFHFMAIAIATTRSAECEEWILWGKQKQADTHTHGMARLVNCVIYSH